MSTLRYWCDNIFSDECEFVGRAACECFNRTVPILIPKVQKAKPGQNVTYHTKWYNSEIYVT